MKYTDPIHNIRIDDKDYVICRESETTNYHVFEVLPDNQWNRITSTGGVNTVKSAFVFIYNIVANSSH